ncbi:MAG: rhomboid family intramembrane serine protease [Bacteroidota bacterium]
MFRLTPTVRNLIMITSLVYLLQMIIGDFVTVNLSLWNVRTPNFKPYQLFTYMFVHSPDSFMHIFFNMLTLVFVGPILETFWGSKRFLLFYIICGIGAGAFNIIMDLFLTGGSMGIMLGASGAIYGVLMGFGMLFPNMEVMLLIPPIPIKAKYLVFVLGGMTFLMDRSGNVAHFAHLGGIIFAFIIIRLWRSQGGSYF